MPLPGRAEFLCVAVVTLVWAATGAPAAAQQIVEEDLTTIDQYAGVPAELAEEIELVGDLMRSLRFEAARARLDELVVALERQSRQQPEGDAQQLLLRALAWRAAANLELGEPAPARADLARIVELDPTAALPVEAGDTLRELFQEERERRIGLLSLDVDPTDASITALPLSPEDAAEPEVPLGSAWPVSAPEAALPAGRYRLELRRPGFAPATLDVELEAGERRPVTIALERTGPTLVLTTRPPGATVTIDGVERGETAPPAGGDAESGVGGGFSSELWIDELDPGSHRIEVSRPGFRSFSQTVEVPEMADLRLPPVVLEQEAATLLLRGVPNGAQVRVDQLVLRRAASGQDEERLRLAPGTRRIFVSLDDHGAFETVVELEDGDVEIVEVELRRPLLLVGVLGNDRAVADRVRQRLAAAVQATSSWTLLERGDVLATTLRESGVTAERVRHSWRLPGLPAIDWPAVQREVERQAEGSLFLLAVLDDDLYARNVELLFWPPTPGPALPDRRTLALDSEESWQAVFTSLELALRSERPSLGAIVVDSALAAGPLVLSVDRDGPAARAGLVAGDVLTAVGATPILTVAQLDEQLAAGSPGELTLEARSGQGGDVRSLRLVPAAAHTTVDPASEEVLRAALAAQILDQLDRASSPAPRWLLQLDLALLHMAAREWEAAIALLRSIEAPTGPGLGQATVDYHLGLALISAGPRYFDRAREILERAAAVEGATLEADDGPVLAPRAEARLHGLGAVESP